MAENENKKMATWVKVLLFILGLGLVIAAIVIVVKVKKKNLIKAILAMDNQPSKVSPGQFISLNGLTEADLKKLSYSDLKAKLKALQAM